MNPPPHIVESALLLLSAFLVGCVIGYFVRKAFPRQAQKPVQATTTPQAAKPEPKPEAKKAPPARKPAPAPVAATPVEPVLVEPTVTESAVLPDEPAPSSEAAVSAESAEPAAATPAVPARRTRKKAVKDDVAASSTIKETDGGVLAAPRNGVADDLKKIKGIGPSMESRLHAEGIYHFDQIAAWNRKTAEAMDARLNGRGRVARENWVAQAKVLAKG